jgi:hypothetical protein
LRLAAGVGCRWQVATQAMLRQCLMVGRHDWNFFTALMQLGLNFLFDQLQRHFDFNTY